MIVQIFKMVILSSCIGSFLTFVLTVLKPLTTKYFSGKWVYFMWIAILIVMLFPASLYPRIDFPSFIEEPAPVSNQENLSGYDAGANINPDTTYHASDRLDSIKNTLKTGMQVISYLWLLGAIILFCTKLVSYHLLLRSIRKQARIVPCPQLSSFTKKTVTVCVWNQLSSPLLIGLVKPMLLLPDVKITQEQMHHVLSHEIMHLKQHDIWYKWLAVFVKCIHWFNPASYYVAKQLQIACEIACDLSVVSNMNQQEKKSYVTTILFFLSQKASKQIPFSTGMAHKQKQIKRRFLMIKNQKKISKPIAIFSAFFAVIILSVTVFTGSVLANTTALYGYEITLSGQCVDFVNAPFIEEDVLYLPLRESLDKFVDASQGVLELQWHENGEMDIYLFDKKSETIREDNGQTIYTRMYYYNPKVGACEVYAGGKVDFILNAPPVLKGDTVYVPAEFLNRMKIESGLLSSFSFRY